MKSETESVFLFVAELTGSFVPGSGTMEDKIVCGKNDYINNILPKLDLSNEEDRKELHELIWLERLYKDLDAYFGIGPDKFTRYLSLDSNNYRTEGFKWNVPVECDAGGSMLQYMGLLLGDKRLLEMTNVIGDTLQDPWNVEGLSRPMIKAAMTPILYGSSQACHQLWQNNNIKYTAEDITKYNDELANGAFGVANLFKEFIINNCNPQAEMKVEIWNEEFTINCNRFRNIGETTKAYKIWDSIEQQYNTILHTDTKKIPDLDQFRRYFVTLLVHNLDSQVADTVIGKVMEKHGFGIPIHDAFIVSPAAATDARQWYTEELKKIYNNRKKILSDFFKSIGITGAAQEQWLTLQSKVHTVEDNPTFNVMALK